MASKLLSGVGSANGAGTGAGATVDAGIGIDHVTIVALGDSANGAFAFASTTADAFFIDKISHTDTSKFLSYSL